MSEEKMREEFETYWRNGGTFCDNPFTSKKETSYDAWQAACSHKDAEFAKEREQLRALIAMQAEALKRAHRKLNAYVGVCKDDKELTEAILPKLHEALSYVAAWEAERLETLHQAELDAMALVLSHEGVIESLRREVAMLRSVFAELKSESWIVPVQQLMYRGNLVVRRANDALNNTQETAESYERELKAKVLEEVEAVADEHYKQMVLAGESNDANSQGRDRCYARARTAEYIRDEITRRKLELRAQSAQKKEGE